MDAAVSVEDTTAVHKSTTVKMDSCSITKNPSSSMDCFKNASSVQLLAVNGTNACDELNKDHLVKPCSSNEISSKTVIDMVESIAEKMAMICHTKSLESLKPLFLYFKEACETSEPIPGFRLGKGGIKIRRHPFLLTRLAARLNRCKETVKVKTYEVDGHQPDSYHYDRDVQSMYTMFGETAFNSDVSTWDTSKVTDFSFLFWYASNFNQSLTKWNTSAVTSMVGMFQGARAFDRDISTWDTSHVRIMADMFYHASKFNQSLSQWNTSAVKSTVSMFEGASAFNGDVSTWDTSRVTSMGRMFSNASNFNQPLSPWNTSAVTSMWEMFYHASSFNQTLCWDMRNVIDKAVMFDGSSGIHFPVIRIQGVYYVLLTASSSCAYYYTARPSARPSPQPTFLLQYM